MSISPGFISRILLCAAVTFTVAGGAAAQRTLIVKETNQPDAVVFADSTIVGRAGQRLFTIPPATDRILVAPPAPVSWSIVPLKFTVDTSTDTVVVDADFPYYYSIRSSPPGALVRLRDGESNFGVTPVVFTTTEPLSDSLQLVLDGFAARSLAAGAALWNPIDVDLTPLGPTSPGYIARGPEKRRRWINVLAVSVAVAGAATAIHYKFQADDRYAVYEETGDPSLRPAIKDLDVKSAIGLGVMQAGVTVFVIRLIRR